MIHLKESKRSLEHLKKIFPDVELFDGIFNVDGAKGISDSFKGVVQKYSSEEYLLIFEDDVRFQADSSIIQLQKAIDSLPEDWDILLGGSYWIESKSRYNDVLDKVTDFCSLHCAFVRKRAFPFFLSHDCSEIRQIDRHLGRFSKEGKLNVYLCNPMVAIQEAGYSYNVKKVVDYSYRLKDFNVL